MLNKDFKKSVIVFLIFIVSLLLIILFRLKFGKTDKKPDPIEKYVFKEQIDCNSDKLTNGQRMFYEYLNDQK